MPDIVDTSVLDKITPRGDSNSITVDDAYSYTPQNFSPEQQNSFDEYQQMNQPVTGMLPENAYYPDSNNNINVGNYSGSIIGSTTLFAPGGGQVPIGMMDARDAAVQRAALQKAKDVEDWRKKFQAPTSKLTNINEHNTEEYYKHLDKSWKGALQKANGNSQMAMAMLKSDPNFNAKTKAFHDIAGNGDAIINKIATDDEEIKTGRFTPTPSYKAVKSKLLKALDPSDPDFKNSGNYFRQMQVERDFSDAFNDVTKKLVASQTGYAGADLNDPEFAKVYEGTVKSWSQEQKDAVAKVLSEDIYGGSDYFTPDKVKKDVYGLLSGIETKKDLSLSAKRAPEGGADFAYDDNDIAKEPSSTNVYTSKGQGKDAAVGESIGDYGVTHKKEIKTTLPEGRSIFINDPEKGLIKSNDVKANANTKLYKTELVKVYDGPAKEHQGTPLSEDQIKAGRPWKYAVMTKGVITEGAGDEKKETQFFIPAKEVENVLVKKRDASGKVVQGIPVDKLEKEAARRNEENGAKKTVAKKEVKVEDLRKKYNY